MLVWLLVFVLVWLLVSSSDCFCFITYVGEFTMICRINLFQCGVSWLEEVMLLEDDEEWEG